MDKFFRFVTWLGSAIGVTGVVVAATALLVPIGALAIFLLMALTIGKQHAVALDAEFYWTTPIIVSLVVLVVGIRSAIRIFRLATTPITAPDEILRRFLTIYLGVQVSAGFCFATLASIYMNAAGELKMKPTELLVVSLFSVFVFIVSTTFISFFMRELIPWRKEHPNLSGAIAFTLSIILGLIAGTFAFAESTTTLFDANSVGAALYRASVMFATVGATLVGAYIAVIKSKSPPDGDAGAV